MKQLLLFFIIYILCASSSCENERVKIKTSSKATISNHGEIRKGVVSFNQEINKNSIIVKISDNKDIVDLQSLTLDRAFFVFRSSYAFSSEDILQVELFCDDIPGIPFYKNSIKKIGQYDSFKDFIGTKKVNLQSDNSGVIGELNHILYKIVNEGHTTKIRGEAKWASGAPVYGDGSFFIYFNAVTIKCVENPPILALFDEDLGSCQ